MFHGIIKYVCMYADQCLVDCQRLNAESMHSPQLCRSSPSNVVANGVACFGAYRFNFRTEAICLVLFETFVIPQTKI